MQSIEGRRLFSFDVPQELLALYAEEGTLTREAALHLKQDAFSTFQAVVTLNGHDHYLGKHGTPQSQAEYDRLIALWLGNGRCLKPSGTMR